MSMVGDDIELTLGLHNRKLDEYDGMIETTGQNLRVGGQMYSSIRHGLLLQLGDRQRPALDQMLLGYHVKRQLVRHYEHYQRLPPSENASIKFVPEILKSCIT
jgi:hypothetical protein